MIVHLSTQMVPSTSSTVDKSWCCTILFVIEDLLGECDTFAAAYEIFLQSGNIPLSLEYDIHRLEEHSSDDNTSLICIISTQLQFYVPQYWKKLNNTPQPSTRTIEEWMLLCRRAADLQQDSDSQPEVGGTCAAQAYPDMKEMLSLITPHRQSADKCTFTTTADPQRLPRKTTPGLHHHNFLFISTCWSH